MNVVVLLCVFFMNFVSIAFCERCLDGISHKQTPTSDDKLHGWVSTLTTTKKTNYEIMKNKTEIFASVRIGVTWHVAIVRQRFNFI
jgi:hypothetical protein